MVIAVQAGFVLLAIFMLVALIFCWKSWKFFHIFAVFLVFCAVPPFLVYSSFVLKTRMAWMSWHSYYEKEVATKEAEAVQLRSGDLDAVKQELDNVAEAQNRYDALLHGRGRVWRGVKPNSLNAAGTQMTVSVPVARPAPPTTPAGGVPAAADGAPAAPATPVPPPVIPSETTLFVFKDIRNADGISVPNEYVGSFKVVASAPGSATLSPVRPLDPVQKRVAQTADPRFTWSLYATMPIDRHDVFTDDSFTDEERQKFIPTVSKLKSMLPKNAYFPASVTPAEYDKKIADIRRNFEISVLHDGKPISELEAAYPGVFVADKDETVAEVEFTQDYKIIVDAESPGQDSSSETAYDSQGRAQISSLMQSQDPVSAGADSDYSTKDGKPTNYTQFRDKQRTVLNLETAEELQRDGVLTIVTKLYRRKLHDFEEEFRDNYIRQNQMRSKLDVLRAENASLKVKVTQLSGPDKDVVGGLQKEREIEVETLRSDLKGYQNEQVELAKAINVMKQNKAAYYKKLGALYNRNLALADELAEIQKQILTEAEKRAREAAEKARNET